MRATMARRLGWPLACAGGRGVLGRNYKRTLAAQQVFNMGQCVAGLLVGHLRNAVLYQCLHTYTACGGNALAPLYRLPHGRIVLGARCVGYLLGQFYILHFDTFAGLVWVGVAGMPLPLATL